MSSPSSKVIIRPDSSRPTVDDTEDLSDLPMTLEQVDQATGADDWPPALEAPSAPRRSSSRLRIPASVQRTITVVSSIPNLGIYVGVVFLLVGFTLIFVAWNKIAPLLVTSLQLPYLASAGFTGLGLVIVGIAFVAGTVKHNDALVRDAQTRELIATQQQLRAALERRAGRAS